MSASGFHWVRKRDGRLVPFEPDLISRALFAAGEQLGRPDPFLARELTDSILHFLSAERPGPVVTSEQIGELVVKVVRELGQPALARAFEEGGRAVGPGVRGDALPAGSRLNEPDLSLQEVARWIEDMSSPSELAWRIAGPALRDYSLQAIFSRDLQAAEKDGLLVLGGLTGPLEMAGCVLDLDSSSIAHLLSGLEYARSVASRFIAVDGADHLLARQGFGVTAAADLVRVLQSGLGLARLAGVLNLNCASPPPGGEELVLGPLFEERALPPGGEGLDDLRETLLETTLGLDPDRSSLRIDWHLRADDLLPASLARLQGLARRIQQGAPLAFVFDRSRRPVALAEGLDRRHPALLMEVGVRLPRLLDQLGHGLGAAEFVHKVGSLARLALSAGTQKRDFLRRQVSRRPGLSAGFLLDRARLKVVPLGLEEAVRRVLGAPAGQDEAVTELCRQVVARLDHVLQEDGQSRLLDTCVGPAFPSADFPETDRLVPPVAGQETVLLVPAEGNSASREQVIEVLRQAWQRTEVTRVQWRGCWAAARQLTAPWETS